MKKIVISGLIIILYLNSYSQNLDLVVTNRLDSLACKIDSISDSVIYLQIKTPASKKWVQTTANKSGISHYQFNCINPYLYDFEEGSSKIIGHAGPVDLNQYSRKLGLDKASPEELNFYLEKATITKKTGKIMTLAGLAATVTGSLLLTQDIFNESYGILFLAGLVSTVAGIPVFIIGSSRVKNMNEIKQSRGMALEIVPYSYHACQTNDQQTGLLIKLRF